MVGRTQGGLMLNIAVELELGDLYVSHKGRTRETPTLMRSVS